MNRQRLNYKMHSFKNFGQDYFSTHKQFSKEHMYSHHEATQLKKEFWTVVGIYMTPVLSAEGEKISWINYKTGERNIFFRMNVDNKVAAISIEFSHPDATIQQIYFEQAVTLKKFLNDASGEEWTWQLHVLNEHGKTVSKIYKELANVSIYNKKDWPKIISFLKQNIIALDKYWSDARYSFEALR